MAVFCHYEPASAQKQLNEGNKYFDRNMFEEAIPFYLKEIESGNPKFRNDAKEKLANCYRLTGQFLEASDMFKQILDKGSKNDKAENYLNYASSLKNAAKYEEAASIFKKYMELAPTDPMGKVYFESCMLAQQWLDREELYFVKNLEVVNSEESEYAPVIYKNGIVFSSARQDSKKKFINFSDNITEICSDLYYIDLMKSQEGQTEVLENLANLNSEQHDGTSTFSSDGTEVYFARTVTGSKNKKTNVILNSLQIFYSKQDMYGNWNIPVSAFSFNSQEYSIAQASLSRDGKKIYIASDMPGGYGKTDLYYCVKQSDDNWGDPINLGPKINTFGHELFPYIHGNDTLYFSSETHQGMGKLDIFMSVFANNEWSAVTNLGNPINSIGDDFGIVLDETQTRGFFSSDRFNGKGKEDIYTLNLIGPQTVFFNGHSIQFPDYTLYNGITFKITEEGANEAVTIASKDGFYTYPIKKEVNYTVNLRRDGFFYDSFKVRLLESSGDTCLNARIQAKTSSFVFGGVLSESNTKISSVSRLKPDSKKVYEIVNDTTVIESPIPEAEIFISRTQKLINKTFTNDQGFYLFPDTLKSGKEYAVLAIKPEKPEIIEEQLTQEQLSKKDSEIAPNNNPSGQPTPAGTTTNKGVPTTTQAGGQGTTNVATTGNQPAGQVAVNGTNGTNVANGTNQPANTTSSNQPATSTNASGQPTTAGTTTNKGVPTTSQTGVQGTTNGVASGNQPTGQVAVNGTNAMNQGVNLNVPNQSGNVTIPLQSEISNTNSELVSGNVVEVKRTIQNANGNKALEGCELKLYQGDQFIENVVSDSKGNVSLKLNEGKDYDLYVTKEGFFQTKIAIVAGTNPSKENIKINLAPIEKNKDIDLKNILFDFNKFNLRRESYSTLDRLADFLRKNPEVTIELNAHTDTRGDYYTNLILAYKRAEATREYLSAKGIQDARIFANGFGETFPIIKNAKTEPEHEQNRRVEMRIIENTGKNVSQTGFSVLSANPYSAEHPFPTGVPVPEGVIYRIKLGSYSKQVPFDTFKGVFPVVQEWDKNKELYSYYAGLFSNQEAAKNALSIVRNEVSEDVYVQAYINNTPVTNEELRKNLEAVSVLNQAESNKLQSTESGFPVFSIQIGAYRNPVKSSLKAEFKKTAGQYGLFVYEFMGNTIYTIGDFHEYTSAVNAMKLLDEKGLPGDAFIIGMINGKRIPVSEAIGIVERYESSKKSNFN